MTTTTAPEVAPEAAPATEDRDGVIAERSIPTQVSAAWELELLIAGAVTFALFQLPSSIDALREWGFAHLQGAGGLVAVTMGYVYAKAVLYVLIVGFVTNLVARSYWVGLIGLHSVYPNGVRWDALRMGPVAAEQYRRRVRSLPAIIGRVDNFASIVFSFAFLVVVTFVFSVAAFGVFALLAWAVSSLLFDGHHMLLLIYAFALALVGPGAVAVAIDKRIGGRIERGGRTWRRLERTLATVATLNGSLLFAPILFTLTSNGGRRRVRAAFYVVVFGALGVSMTEWFYRSDLLRAATPAYVPDDADVQSVNGTHYESLRPPRAGDLAPTIQSDVVDGPYVRLFIPYRQDRHDYAIRTRCPGVQPLRISRLHLVDPPDDPARVDDAALRVLDCLTRLSAVTVDGTPVPNAPFRFYQHPTSGAPGMIAYLPTAGLAAGMHTISIAPLPRLPSSRSTRPLVPTVITFWR
jgi:hypothetical protein